MKVTTVQANGVHSEQVRKNRKNLLKDENKELRRELKRKSEELESLKEETKALAYFISHDVRAPLRAIKGFSNALMEDFNGLLNESSARYLQRISHNSKKMQMLIDAILVLSRVSRKKPSFTPIATKDLFNGLIGEKFANYKDRITVGDVPNIKGDPDLLEILFHHLLSNATKFSFKEDRESAITIDGNKSKKMTIISVSDEGIGFDMTYAEKIFTLSQRLHSDEEFEGAGVGLTVCKKIMEIHKGEIWAESEPEKGAIFYVAFPSNLTN